jgi:hypothetical protein
VWCHAPTLSTALSPDTHSSATDPNYPRLPSDTLSSTKCATSAVGRYTVSTTDPQQPATRRAPPVPSIQDIFGDTPTLQSAEDLARDGIFDDGEVEELIADLYAMRRSDVA